LDPIDRAIDVAALPLEVAEPLGKPLDLVEIVVSNVVGQAGLAFLRAASRARRTRSISPSAE